MSFYMRVKSTTIVSPENPSGVIVETKTSGRFQCPYSNFSAAILILFEYPFDYENDIPLEGRVVAIYKYDPSSGSGDDPRDFKDSLVFGWQSDTERPVGLWRPFYSISMREASGLSPHQIELKVHEQSILSPHSKVNPIDIVVLPF